MATLDVLEVPYSRKVQLDQFEPVEMGATATFTMDADDDPYEVYHDGQATVQQMVERELAERIARKKMDELGPSVPAVVAVIREHTNVLDDETVESDEWTASLSAESVNVGGSLSLTEITVRFEGDDDVLEDVVERFSRKAMRAGG